MRARGLVAGVAWLAVTAATQASPQAPGGEPTFRVVRSVSGSRGAHKGGRYEVEDPRSVFSLPADRQIVVYFEWEGPLGRHRCEARWKDPTGRVVLVAPTEYQATTRRFGIYWSLALADNVAVGLWAVEVFVNGEPAGTHVLEIRGGAAPSATGLAAAEIYQRALTSVATLERLGPAGEVLGLGVATALDADLLLAPFPAIEAGTSLRLHLADGRAREASEIGAWNRKEGWAVIRLPGHGLSVLARGSKPGIGQRVFALDTADDGARVINETPVVGFGSFRSGRSSLRLQSQVAAGSPVLNERAECVGLVLGADLELGPAWVRVAAFDSRHQRGNSVLPLELLPAFPAGSVVTLADLGRGGAFVKPLSADSRHVISGVFAARVERGGAAPVPMPLDQRSTYSRREGSVSVFVQWNPQDKKDVSGHFEVYDLDNQTVMRGQPSKLKLRKNELFFMTWVMPIQGIGPATYRVDLLLDGEPIWRGHVRVTE